MRAAARVGLFSVKDKKEEQVEFDTKGTLKVPPDAKIEYLEPAIMVEVKRGKHYLFAKPPEHNKSEYEHSISLKGGLFSKRSTIVDVAELNGQSQTTIARMTKAGTKELQILEQEFDHSVQVLARPFEYPDPANPSRWIVHPYVMEVTTFEQTGEGINIQKTGYMYKDDLSFTKEKFIKFDGDVLPKLPETRDVRQAQMNDCFFLSSINAILSQPGGRQFIMNMMKQQDDGSIIVRLNHPKTLHPVYVRVDNSEHHIKGTSTVHHTSSWVHILEKAYAGLGFGVDKDKFSDGTRMLHSSFEAVYSSIGGKSDLALTILTGVSADIHVIKQQDSFPFTLSNLADCRMAASVSPKARSSLMEVQKELNGPLFKAIAMNPEAYLEFGNYLNALTESDYYHFEELIKIGSISAMTSEGYDYLLEKLNEFQPAIPERCMALFSDYNHPNLNEKSVATHAYSGRVGSGEYTASDRELFDELSSLKTSERLLTASTKEKFDEGVVPGLVNYHAYAMTDVHKKNINGKELLFVRLRNPWGGTGRVYDFANDEKYERNGSSSCAVENRGHAEFDIDIIDFRKYFSHYTAGTLSALPTLSLGEAAIARPKAA